MPESEKNDAPKNGNGNGNGVVRRLNNTQRKELAKIVERRYESRISEQDDNVRKEFEAKRLEALVEAKKRLGVDKIERQMKDLELQKKALGYNYGDIPENGSKGKEVYEEILKTYTQEKATLREERDALLARIWMVETVEEAEAIVGVEATPHA